MTKLDYLKNTCKYESSATVTDVKETEHGIALILDQTIFYPQGGGQPSDTGEIIGKDGRFVVSKVMLDQDGIVNHFGQFTQGILKKNDKVELIIDKEKRISNAKLHSAGHLISSVVSDVLKLDITPYKGYHFQDSPYVECHGTIENKEEIKEQIQKQIDILIDKDLKINIEDLDLEEAKKRGYSAPVGKSVRIVGFEGFESNGCGGTHVNSSKELKGLIIRKISSKKGKTKICYVFS